jgi:hypothetical protein
MASGKQGRVRFKHGSTAKAHPLCPILILLQAKMLAAFRKLYAKTSNPLQETQKTTWT